MPVYVRNAPNTAEREKNVDQLIFSKVFSKIRRKFGNAEKRY